MIITNLTQILQLILTVECDLDLDPGRPGTGPPGRPGTGPPCRLGVSSPPHTRLKSSPAQSGINLKKF